MSRLGREAVKQAIVLPKRIKRSPTDLLTALASTLNVDSHSPYFKYLDDPFTIPFSISDRKSFSLAKASGAKAAQFMISQYPEAFYKQDCEPHVGGFFPKKTFSEEEIKYPSETLIYSYLDWGQMLDAFNTYLSCKDQNIEISDTCRLALLDLLCIYNNSNLVDRRHPLEEFYNRSVDLKMREQQENYLVSSWKDDCPAQMIFNDINQKPTSAYCSLIKGMAMNFEVKRAFELYENLKTQNANIDVETYNELIKLTAFDNTEKKLDIVLGLLNDMKINGAKPNLRTFNNSLLAMSRINQQQSKVPIQSKALSCVKEMRILGIKPSLGTWNHFLNIFYPAPREGDLNALLYVLNEVDEMDKKEGLKWCDDADGEFFNTAINKATYFRSQSDIINRIHKLLMRGANRQFLTSDLAESRYFGKYLVSVINNETSEVVIKEWNSLVPYESKLITPQYKIFSPSSKLNESMLLYMNDFQLFDFVPKYWSDLLLMESIRSPRFSQTIIEGLLNMMNRYDGTSGSSALMNNYGEITRAILNKFPIIPIEGETLLWNGTMLSDVLTIMIKIDDYLTAWTYFEMFTQNRRKVYGDLSENCLTYLFTITTRNNHVDRALMVIDEFIRYDKYEAAIRLVTILNERDLTQNQKLALQNFKKSIEQKLLKSNTQRSNASTRPRSS